MEVEGGNGTAIFKGVYDLSVSRAKESGAMWLVV